MLGLRLGFGLGIVSGDVVKNLCRNVDVIAPSVDRFDFDTPGQILYFQISGLE